MIEEKEASVRAQIGVRIAGESSSCGLEIEVVSVSLPRSQRLIDQSRKLGGEIVETDRILAVTHPELLGGSTDGPQ